MGPYCLPVIVLNILHTLSDSIFTTACQMDVIPYVEMGAQEVSLTQSNLQFLREGGSI